MSRLGRGDAGIIAEYSLQKANVRVEYSEQSFTDDISGTIHKSTMRLVEFLQTQEASMQTKTKMEAMVREGYFCGGTVPYGYRTELIRPRMDAHEDVPKRLVVEENEANVVRLAYDRFLVTRSIAATRDFLKAATCRNWTSTTAKYLLTNPVYIGVQWFGDWQNLNAHEAIVDRVTWDKAQETAEAISTSRIRGARICHDYEYHLKGLVRCPHCGCPYTNGAAKGGLVRYYQCLDDTKQKCKCPVGRINADALHRAILEEVHRVANHRTAMHKLIVQSGGWRGPDGDDKSLRGQLAKKKQFNEVQINNITRAISEGRSLGPLLSTLEKLERERDAIAQELERVEAEIACKTVVRPTADVVQQAWKQILDVWDDLSEDDRTEVMQSLVQEVVVTEKNSVDVRLRATPHFHAQEFITTYKLGAGAGVGADSDKEHTPLVTVLWTYADAGQGSRQMQRIGLAA